MNNIAIIGGGASGMFAAIAAAENSSNRITIYERASRIGRKILATGNGRCNMTNINAAPENYHGENPEFVRYAIDNFWVSETLDIFSRMGILYKCEDGVAGHSGGKVYPYSDQASSVLDVLRRELDRRGVIVKCNFDVKSIKKENKRFVITPYKGDAAYADKVIIASGGKAAPDLGSNGSGYALLKSFGHHITELRPSLVQLKTGGGTGPSGGAGPSGGTGPSGDTAKKLKGIKVNANVTLGKFSEYDEVLFTDYGLSGPAVFSLSSRLDGQKTVTLDIMPEYSFPEIVDMLLERRANLGDMPLEEFFTGMLNKRVGQVILKSVTGVALSQKSEILTDAQIRALAAMIKKWEFKISGTMSWNSAQVTKGGARTSEFNPETMESRLVRGLYACGEVLDIDGDCGGYNLQWAWSSGYIAGKNCSEVK